MRHRSRTVDLAKWMLGVLAVLVVLGVRLRLEADESPRSVAYWSADRAGGAVVGLDSELFVVRRFQQAWPIRVVSWRAGGLGGVVVASAVAGDPEGPHEIRALDSGGVCVRRWPCDPVIDLAAAGDRAVVIVETVGGRALVELCLRTGGELRARGSPSFFTGCAISGDRLFVGTGHGLVHCFEEGARSERIVQPVQQVTDLEPGPEPGSAWVLDSTAPGRLVRLGSDLRAQWSIDLQLAVGAQRLQLIASPGRERVWLIEPEADRVRCFGPGGRQLHELQLDAAGGLERGVADAAGGLLLPAVGSIRRLGPDGRPRLGQGGFDFVVDVCRAHAAARWSAPNRPAHGRGGALDACCLAEPTR